MPLCGVCGLCVDGVRSGRSAWLLLLTPCRTGTRMAAVALYRRSLARRPKPACPGLVAGAPAPRWPSAARIYRGPFRLRTHGTDADDGDDEDAMAMTVEMT